MMNPTVWYLQHGNEPIHRQDSKVVKEWNQNHGVNVHMVSGWPHVSPGSSLIDNFWSHVQKWVDAKGCESFSEFKNVVISDITSQSPTMFKYLGKLFDSMPRKVAKVIWTGGEKPRLSKEPP